MKGDPINFRVYFRRDGPMKELADIRRNENGLYFNETRSPILQGARGPAVEFTESQLTVRRDDVVIDWTADHYCLEFMIWDRVIDHGTLTPRPNSRWFIKPHVFPVLALEVFQPSGSPLDAARFPPTEDRIEGVNVFFGSGKLRGTQS